MKRTLWLMPLLAAVFACAARAAVWVPIDYEGAYVPLAGHRASLYLPDGWLLTRDADALLAARSADGTRRMAVRAYGNEDSVTLDALLAQMEMDSAYQDARPVRYGGFPFIAYAYPAGDLFGAISASADGAVLYFFTFAPYTDEGLRTLAGQMLSTLTETPPQ